MKQKQQLGLIAIAVMAILIPASYVLYLILQSGELSNFDYWWITWNFYSVDGFSTNPFNWMFRANEHFLLIPSLLYALNIVVTKGSNLGLSLITWGLAWIQCHLLITLLPLKLRQSPFQLIFLILCIAVFNFTPAAAHNWMRGFSGVAWMGANLFVIASIFCLTKAPQELKLQSNHKTPSKETLFFSSFFKKFKFLTSKKSIGQGKSNNAETEQENFSIQWLITSIIFAILASLTYSTSLALWPILCVVPILLRWPLKIIIFYFTTAILVIATYFITYHTPSTSPSLEKLSLAKSLPYFPIYLGGIFSNNVNLCLGIGLGGFLIFFGFAGFWLFSKKYYHQREWLPWLSIQVYSLGTALMAAVSRSGFGVEQATASRYASLPALFWLSAIILTVLWVRQWQVSPRNQGRFLTPLLAVVTIAMLSMYRIGGETAAAIAHRATYQPLVALSVQLGVTDVHLIQERVGNRPAAFIGLVDALKANGLVPFNRDVKQNNFCATLGVKIDPNLLSAPKEGLLGYFDNFTQFTPTAGRVIGWVGDPENQVKCIAILNQDNVVRGFALSGFSRPNVANLYGRAYELSGWKGYTQISATDKLLTAYASFKNREGWIALRNSQVLPKN
ncbi:MAG: hypothetical protein ACM37W_08055 [Actinomycetota bacterium]